MAENQPPRPGSPSEQPENSSFEDRMKKFREEQLGEWPEEPEKKDSQQPTPPPPPPPVPPLEQRPEERPEHKEQSTPPFQPKPLPVPPAEPAREEPAKPEPPRPAPPLPQQAQQPDQLKHEDVQTMQKEIKRLREEEVQQVRERILSGKPEPDIKEEEMVKQIRSAATSRSEANPPSSVPTPPPFLKTPPKKPSKTAQLLVRGLVFVIVLGLVVSGGIIAYSYFAGQSPTETPPQDNEQNQQDQQPDENPDQQPDTNDQQPPVEQTKDTLPLSFAKTGTFLITNNTVTPVLTQTLAQAHPAGFTKVLFKKEDSNAVLSTTEMLNALQISVPLALREQFQNGSTFFLHYYQEEGRKRFGFFIPLKQGADVASTLSNWEPTLEEDTAFLTNLVGGKGQSYTAQFKSHEYKGQQIRYQTLSRNDVGVVYAVIDNVFILTTSLGSMEQAIDALQ